MDGPQVIRRPVLPNVTAGADEERKCPVPGRRAGRLVRNDRECGARQHGMGKIRGVCRACAGDGAKARRGKGEEGPCQDLSAAQSCWEGPPRFQSGPRPPRVFC